MYKSKTSFCTKSSSEAQQRTLQVTGVPVNIAMIHRKVWLHMSWALYLCNQPFTPSIQILLSVGSTAAFLWTTLKTYNILIRWYQKKKIPHFSDCTFSILAPVKIQCSIYIYLPLEVYPYINPNLKRKNICTYFTSIKSYYKNR